jgi:hypothetical protein
MPSTFSSGISIVGVVEPERKTNGKGPSPTSLSYTRAVVVSADVNSSTDQGGGKRIVCNELALAGKRLCHLERIDYPLPGSGDFLATHDTFLMWIVGS